MTDSVLEVQNIKLPDSGGVTSSTAITLDASGNVTLAGTANDIGTVTSGTFNGTIGDSAVLSDSYYLQGELNTTYSAALGGGVNINFDESTPPYWDFTTDSDWDILGAGSNFSQGTTTADLKIHRAGIYLINFSATGLESNAERAFDIRIHGVGSGSSNILGRSIDNIAIAESGGNYGNASVSIIHKFSANDQINFFISSAAGSSADIYAPTHFNICLIRPL